MGLERFPEVRPACPAEEERPDLGLQLVGPVAFTAGLTGRDGMVCAHFKEERLESNEHQHGESFMCRAPESVKKAPKESSVDTGAFQWIT